MPNFYYQYLRHYYVMLIMSCSLYLWDIFAVAEDVDLLDGKLTPSLHIVAEKHLTKPTDSENTTLLPLGRCHRSYAQHIKHTCSLLCTIANRLLFSQNDRAILTSLLTSHPCCSSLCKQRYSKYSDLHLLLHIILQCSDRDGGMVGVCPLLFVLF